MESNPASTCEVNSRHPIGGYPSDTSMIPVSSFDEDDFKTNLLCGVALLEIGRDERDLTFQSRLTCYGTGNVNGVKRADIEINGQALG